SHRRPAASDWRLGSLDEPPTAAARRLRPRRVTKWSGEDGGDRRYGWLVALRPSIRRRHPVLNDESPEVGGRRSDSYHALTHLNTYSPAHATPHTRKRLYHEHHHSPQRRP